MDQLTELKLKLGVVQYLVRLRNLFSHYSILNYRYPTSNQLTNNCFQSYSLIQETLIIIINIYDINFLLEILGLNIEYFAFFRNWSKTRNSLMVKTPSSIEGGPLQCGSD